MKLSKATKLLVLAASVWLPLYMVAFMVMVASRSVPSFEVLMRVHIGTMLIQIVLLVVYIAHLFRTTHVATDKRTLWAITLFFGAPLAMPIYWFAHMWPDTGLTP